MATNSTWGNAHFGDEAEYRRKLAFAMALKRADQPILHPLQGINNVAREWMGALEDRQREDRDREGAVASIEAQTLPGVAPMGGGSGGSSAAPIAPAPVAKVAAVEELGAVPPAPGGFAPKADDPLREAAIKVKVDPEASQAIKLGDALSPEVTKPDAKALSMATFGASDDAKPVRTTRATALADVIAPEAKPKEEGDFFAARAGSKKVHFTNMNPDFQQRLQNAVKEAEAATGHRAVFTSGSRHPEEQVEIHARSRREGFTAAPPGRSRHEHAAHAGGAQATDVARGPVLDYLRKNRQDVYTKHGLEFLPDRLNDPAHIQHARAWKPPQGGVQVADQQSGPLDLNRARPATASIESGGDYNKLGPVIPKSGDRAYGKYGVMGANVAPWTREILGKELTPAQFLFDRDAQDKVYGGKMQQYARQFGPENAAKAWFAGPTGYKDDSRKDMLGTTVGAYGQKFNAAYGADINQAQPQYQQTASLGGGPIVQRPPQNVPQPQQPQQTAQFDPSKFNMMGGGSISGGAPMAPPPRPQQMPQQQGAPQQQMPQQQMPQQQVPQPSRALPTIPPEIAAMHSDLKTKAIAAARSGNMALAKSLNEDMRGLVKPYLTPREMWYVEVDPASGDRTLVNSLNGDRKGYPGDGPPSVQQHGFGGAVTLTRSSGRQQHIGPNADILRGQLAFEKDKAGAKPTGEGQATTQMGLENALTQGARYIALVEKIASHPGLGYATGLWGQFMSWPTSDIPRPQQYIDWRSRQDQLKGQVFVSAIEGFKGAGLGAWSDAEGKQAVAANQRDVHGVSMDEAKATYDEQRTWAIRNSINTLMKTGQYANQAEAAKVLEKYIEQGRKDIEDPSIMKSTITPEQARQYINIQTELEKRGVRR